VAADCIFCRILAGELPASFVLEEEHVVGFLDVKPLRLGHVLVVPREHHVTLPDLPVALVTPLFGAVRRVADAVVRGLGVDGSFLGVNNVVSQSVPHLHVHVVPRRKGDGLRGFFWPRDEYASPEEAESHARRIREALSP
jgi:histidine triad (HIT) family protein